MKFEKNEYWKIIICIIIVCMGFYFLLNQKDEFVELNQYESVFIIDLEPKTVVVPKTIDMDIIVDIESTNNPKAVSPVGARGLCQIMPKTWKECTKRMKVDWGWDEAFDAEKNLKVGTYYMNKRIPQMLKYYKLGDTFQQRIIAYNWGIGNLKNYTKGKIKNLPKETSDYIKKYSSRYAKKA